MRERISAAFLAWVLMAGAACEMEWGKGGFIDRSMRKDIRENAGRDCAGGKTWKMSERAPRDCLEENDPRPECAMGCFGPGE
jgi:hypothetical protein